MDRQKDRQNDGRNDGWGDPILSLGQGVQQSYLHITDEWLILFILIVL